MPVIQCCQSTRLTPIHPHEVEVRQVLAAEFYRDGSATIPFAALSNVPSGKIELAISVVNKVFPMNTKFNYLKRIRRGAILLGPTDAAVTGVLMDQLREAGISAEDMLVEEVPVPAFPVLTKSQYVTANLIWPVRVTIPLIDDSARVQPAVVREICDKINHLISRNTSSGGVCSFESPEGDVAVIGEANTSDPIYHFQHCVLDACRQVGKVSDYLATGYRVFCLGEPCVMCAMALLHSRVREVVFLASPGAADFHGLGGSVSVHCHRQLNHHFSVFRVDLVQ